MGTVLTTPFNEAQVEILKLFSSGLTDKQLDELRKLLITFKFQLLDTHVEKIISEKGLTDDDIEKVSSEHWRTPYKRLPKQNL